MRATGMMTGTMKMSRRTSTIIQCHIEIVPIGFLPSLRRHGGDRLGMRVRRVFVDAPLDLGTEVADEALHRPGGAVAEGADGVALDLGGHLPEHVDLALVGAALRH